jgi:hypothetical protein
LPPLPATQRANRASHPNAWISASVRCEPRELLARKGFSGRRISKRPTRGQSSTNLWNISRGKSANGSVDGLACRQMTATAASSGKIARNDSAPFF